MKWKYSTNNSLQLNSELASWREFPRISNSPKTKQIIIKPSLIKTFVKILDPPIGGDIINSEEIGITVETFQVMNPISLTISSKQKVLFRTSSPSKIKLAIITSSIILISRSLGLLALRTNLLPVVPSIEASELNKFDCSSETVEFP